MDKLWALRLGSPEKVMPLPGVEVFADVPVIISIRQNDFHSAFFST